MIWWNVLLVESINCLLNLLKFGFSLSKFLEKRSVLWYLRNSCDNCKFLIVLFFLFLFLNLFHKFKYWHQIVSRKFTLKNYSWFLFLDSYFLNSNLPHHQHLDSSHWQIFLPLIKPTTNPSRQCQNPLVLLSSALYGNQFQPLFTTQTLANPSHIKLQSLKPFLLHRPFQSAIYWNGSRKFTYLIFEKRSKNLNIFMRNSCRSEIKYIQKVHVHVPNSQG